MVESTNLDPRAASVASPDVARNSVLDAATDIFATLSGITTQQGEVDAITLDLLDSDGTEDTDFRASAYSAQTVTTDSHLGIKQKVYLQTDASRLAELGSLSSTVFQKKYSELNRILINKFTQNKISETELRAAQDAMLRGGAALRAVIDKYNEVVNGVNTLKGFRTLAGLFNEPEVQAMLDKKVAADTSADKPSKNALIDKAIDNYFDKLDFTKLANKDQTVAAFLLEQRSLIDGMLESNPLESSASYIKRYTDEITKLFDFSANDFNISANMSWEDLQAKIDGIVAKFMAMVDGAQAKINNLSLRPIVTDYNFAQIDDNDGKYGIDTDPNNAARIFDGRVFEYKTNSAGTYIGDKPLKQVYDYIQARITNAEAEGLSQTKVNGYLALTDIGTGLRNKIEALTVTDGVITADDIKIKLSDLTSLTTANLPDGEHYYNNGVLSFGTVPAGLALIDYHGLRVAIPAGASDTVKAQEILKAAFLERRITSDIAIVFKDNRTIADVIDGKNFGDTSYDQLSDLDKLFAGTNQRARSVTGTINNKLNTVENEYLPILAEGGQLLRNSDKGKLLPLINSKGEEVAEVDLKRDTNGNLLIPLRDSKANNIKLFTENNRPVVQLKTNTDKAKQQLLNINGTNIVVNSVSLSDDGKVQAPDYIENLWGDNGTLSIVSPETEVVFDKSSKTIKTINGEVPKAIAVMKFGASQVSFDYVAGDISLADRYARESLAITVGTAAGAEPRDVVRLGTGSSQQLAVLKTDSNIVDYFISVDSKGKQKVTTPERSNIVVDAQGNPISLIAANTALAKIDLKRSNQGKMLFALEDLAASKQNSQQMTAKLPDPRNDGSLPSRSIAPPSLAPTATAAIIARLAQEVAEKADAMRRIDINTDAIDGLQTAVNDFNSDLAGTHTKSLREKLQALLASSLGSEAVTNAKKDFEDAKLAAVNDVTLFANKLKVNVAGNQVALLTLKNYLNEADNLNKSIAEIKNHFADNSGVLALLNGLASTTDNKASKFFEKLPKQFSLNELVELQDNGNYVLDLNERDVSKLTDSQLSTLNNFIDYLNNQDNADKSIAELKNSFQNLLSSSVSNTETNKANKIFAKADLLPSKANQDEVVEKFNAYTNAVKSSFDSDSETDETKGGSLESLAKKWLEDDNGSIKKALDTVQDKVESFSKDINAFNANLNKTFGVKSSDTNVDNKGIRELILLMMIFSIFEESEWEYAQAEADNSRYQITE